MTVVAVETDTGAIVSRTLDECEAVIEHGLHTFLDVGEALAEINELRLYKASHDTFDDYCRERWGLSRSRAYELIEAAEVAELMSGIPDTPQPQNAGQASALGPLKGDPEALAAAAKAAADEAEGKQPTAAQFKQAVADEVAKRKAVEDEKQRERAEQRKEQDDFKSKHQPPGFDEKAEQKRLETRGSLASLCRSISKLQAPADFVAEQREFIKERHIDLVEKAYAWLDEFLLTYREGQ